VTDTPLTNAGPHAHRLALSKTEAAKALGVSVDFFDEHVATAFFAGLRRGELLALRWEDVDLAAGVLRVERSYDPKARQYVAPKSRAGRRVVPIAALREHLIIHRLDSGRSEGLVFGKSGLRAARRHGAGEARVTQVARSRA